MNTFEDEFLMEAVEASPLVAADSVAEPLSLFNFTNTHTNAEEDNPVFALLQQATALHPSFSGGSNSFSNPIKKGNSFEFTSFDIMENSPFATLEDLTPKAFSSENNSTPSSKPTIPIPSFLSVPLQQQSAVLESPRTGSLASSMAGMNITEEDLAAGSLPSPQPNNNAAASSPVMLNHSNFIPALNVNAANYQSMPFYTFPPVSQQQLQQQVQLQQLQQLANLNQYTFPADNSAVAPPFLQITRQSANTTPTSPRNSSPNTGVASPRTSSPRINSPRSSPFDTVQQAPNFMVKKNTIKPQKIERIVYNFCNLSTPSSTSSSASTSPAGSATSSPAVTPRNNTAGSASSTPSVTPRNSLPQPISPRIVQQTIGHKPLSQQQHYVSAAGVQTLYNAQQDTSPKSPQETIFNGAHIDLTNTAGVSVQQVAEESDKPSRSRSYSYNNGNLVLVPKPKGIYKRRRRSSCTPNGAAPGTPLSTSATDTSNLQFDFKLQRL